MLVHKGVEGKLRQLLGHYIEIDREALKIGVQIPSDVPLAKLMFLWRL